MKPTDIKIDGKVLFVKGLNKDYKTYNDFQWPSKIGKKIKCQDWIDNTECGNGLHGWPWGFFINDGKNISDCSKFLVFSAKKDIVYLDGKCKVKEARIEFVGSLPECMKFCEEGRHKFIIKNSNKKTSSSGNYSSASSSGNHSSASSSGDYSSASSSGDFSSASSSGYRSSASSSGNYSSASSSGDWSSVCTSGERTMVHAKHGAIAVTAMKVNWIPTPNSVLLQVWFENNTKHYKVFNGSEYKEGAKITIIKGEIQ